ncbi:MAG: HAD family hydrolase [Miltoncostaeaceae bacterium]
MGFRGAIFDVDGVLVESPHERAWRETLEFLMLGAWSDIRDRTSWSPNAVTNDVYRNLISGKPRMDGARAALQLFGVPDVDLRAERYAELKQEEIVDLIAQGEFTAFPDALRFVLDVREMGMSLAAASSSKNANMFLERIDMAEFCRSEGRDHSFVRDGTTLLELFDGNVCGWDFPQGKPHPEIFLTAAEQIGVPAKDSFVVEDAVSGIQAAKSGAIVGLGVARLDDEAELRDAGGDLVVTSLDDVDRPGLARGVMARRSS